MNKNQRRVTIRLSIPRLRMPRFAGLRKKTRALTHWFQHTLLWRDRRIRYSLLLVAGVFLLSNIITVLQPFFTQHSYELGEAAALLPEKNAAAADKLTFDTKQQAYTFEYGRGLAQGSAQSNVGMVAATAHKNPAKGVTVTDPLSKVDFTMRPKFDLNEGRKDGNRIIYPLSNGSGWLVYTMQPIGVKEDVVLTHAPGKTLELDYTLELGNGLEAKLERDGSIGVYGNRLFSSNVATGTAKDAELLQKARENAPKNTLLFSIPAPVIFEYDSKQHGPVAKYELNGSNLRVKVSNLESGDYPLTIDPSIYVTSAEQFMYGNNESNINFDVDNRLIKKGRTTGARFDSWQSTASLPSAVWGGQAVASGGYLYSMGGAPFSGSVYGTQGADTFTVPAGITTIDVKMWGGGGGAGGGGTNTTGGAGGGAGSISASLSVTPGENLAIYIGGGGAGGAGGANGNGGGGGGTTSIKRGATNLIIAAGGAGGGGGRNTATAGTAGGPGGSGGASSDGIDSAAGSRGRGGTTSAGGAGGTSGCAGAAGTLSTGGAGGGRNILGCQTGGGGAGGLTGGGAGGIQYSVLANYAGGGGGGAGIYGGGGGAGSPNGANSGAGGGGGANYADPGANAVTNYTGGAAGGWPNAYDPGNKNDINRGNAGNGGTCTGNGCTGTAGTTGLIAISYSGNFNPASRQVSWAKFDTGNGTIVSANPGGGTCSGWCSNSSYALPDDRSNFAAVAYNGYIYVMGGSDITTARTKSVMVAKLGANGEPQRWQPTSSDPRGTWFYDTTNMNLQNEVTYTAAVAYNNKMYLIGGLQNGGTYGTATADVWVADILPNGKLGSWSASTSLGSGGPGAIYGHSAVVYNDRIYIFGGSTGVGTDPGTYSYYIKINSSGALASSWKQTTSLPGPRMNMGGTNAVVWGGYIYLTGGCADVKGGGSADQGICRTGFVLNDTIVASINADGSLGAWKTVTGATNQRMGFGLVSWRDRLYIIGGCSDQNQGSGDCLSGVQAGIDYGSINQDGDVSVISTSVASGTAPCSGATPTNCNLPGTGSVGNLLTASVIANGYLYVTGGCTGVLCNAVSNGVAFTTIAANGDTVRPATCPTGSTATNGWCVMNTNMPANLAGASPVVFNNTLYLVGGFTGGGMAGNIKRAPLNADGTVGTWSTDTLTTIGATSVSYTYATARANPASASSQPGNLYIFGGCTDGNSGNCTTYTDAVYKCNIGTSGAVTSCSTSGQLQIGTPSEATGAGMGMAGGTVYANYIYLIGGSAPGANEMAKVRYAKFDNSNNVVTAGSGWVESPAGQTMAASRRLATSYGYNGYLYVVGGSDASTVRSDIIFIKLNTSDGSLSTEGWKTSTVTISGRWGAPAPVSNSYVYVIGGCTAGTPPNCSTMSTATQRFQVYNNDSGGPASFTAQGAGMGVDRIGGSAAILNGYIYYAGGCTTMNCSGTTTNSNYYAQLDTYGVPQTWTAATSNLPASLAWGKLLAAGGTLYYVGGQTGAADTTAVDTVYYTSGISAGVPTWSGSAATRGIGDTGSGAAKRTKFGAAVWNDRLYVVGGNNETPAAQTTVYVSPQQASGGNITGNWTSTTAFNVGRLSLSLVAYANNLYILGGSDGTNYLSDTQYAKINSNGTVGGWSYSTSLPGPIADGDAFAANGYIYLVGGRSASTTCPANTLVAPISANTAVASGNTPTGIGAWNESRVTYGGDRYGAPAVYNDGMMYLIGGGCSSFVNSTTERNHYASLQTQPQLAKYSIAFDTEGDVYPSHWLMNGLDNEIGGRWLAKYRSMSDPSHVWSGTTGQACSSSVMSNWGQETTKNPVALKQVEVFTARDGAGTDMKCARYYYFNATIDATQSYGFPDDVSRGPTLTDITLRFSSEPSKRLMHGRTFIGGQQMPDDTPYYAY